MSGAMAYAATQLAGAVCGAWAAHAMFGTEIFQFSAQVRTGSPRWISEVIAAGGLVLAIIGGIKHRPSAVPMLVGLFITAAYWFTASTSFANPAVTFARALTDTYSGIAPASAPMFIICQFLGAGVAVAVAHMLFVETEDKERI